MSQFLSVIHKFSVLSSMQLFITEGGIQSIHHMALLLSSLFRVNSTTYCSDTFCILPNHCCMYWVCHSASGLISCPDLKHAMKLNRYHHSTNCKNIISLTLLLMLPCKHQYIVFGELLLTAGKVQRLT